MKAIERYRGLPGAVIDTYTVPPEIVLNVFSFIEAALVVKVQGVSKSWFEILKFYMDEVNMASALHELKIDALI